MLKSFIKINLLVMIISNLVNFSNYIIMMLLGRFLSPADYGIYNSVCSIGVILSFFSPVFYNVSMKFVIKYQDNRSAQWELIKYLGKWVSYIGGAFSFTLILLAPVFSRYLKLGTVTPLIIFIFTIFSVLELTFRSGILNAFYEYVNVNIQIFINAMIRLSLCILFVAVLGFSYNMAIAAALISNIVTVFLMTGTINSKFSDLDRSGDYKITLEEVREILFFSVPVLLMNLSVYVITNLDIITVKHLFSPEEAGIYSGASVVGRIAFFLPQMVINVLFSEIVKNSQNNESSMNIILLILSLTTVASGSVAAVAYFFPEEILSLLLGKTFATAAIYLPTITAAMAVASVINVLFIVCLAKSIYGFLVPTYICLSVMIVGIYFFCDDSPLMVAQGMLCGGLAIFFINYGLLIFSLIRKKI
ncbi:MAG: oligosaccharide flippase family protein [Oligoflexales bacterium]|nr:oligosaccharide flippase family protein [Oligoflexales bacterium]